MQTLTVSIKPVTRFTTQKPKVTFIFGSGLIPGGRLTCCFLCFCYWPIFHRIYSWHMAVAICGSKKANTTWPTWSAIMQWRFVRCPFSYAIHAAMLKLCLKNFKNLAWQRALDSWKFEDSVIQIQSLMLPNSVFTLWSQLKPFSACHQNSDRLKSDSDNSEDVRSTCWGRWV